MRNATLALAGFLALAGAAYAADDPLAAAKDLYAAAAYEDALATLTKLSETGTLAPAVGLQVDQYRTFCLIALGRTKDAESMAQGIIRRNPIFELSADESSPRVEAMFTQVRRQLLPTLIRDKYREAKAAADRKENEAAVARFTEVRQMIAKASQFGIKDDAIGDLAILVDGFLDLARAAAAPKPAENSAVETPVAANVPAPRPAPRDPRELFNAASTDVVPPVVIRQPVPPVPQPIAKLAKKRGTFDVTIEADGRVSEVTVRESIQAAYDTMITNAAKNNWRYKPATTKDGTPVRYVKSIALEVQQD